ncbi:unnamed protein product [Triticum turgidum subsp. durum]|uniref:Uncharacterized protein n=1 Tax=Triticum turgidum subsp. durum TaxID=4567 RepID=A0A9R0SET6_TRITD|nr:unnamed protein product [Triticum turgidum subsp. durum]
MVSFSVVIEVTHQCLGYTEVCHLSEIYAVDCCKDTNHITVARENSILSSGLKERCCMALLFQLCPGSDLEGTDIKEMLLLCTRRRIEKAQIYSMHASDGSVPSPLIVCSPHDMPNTIFDGIWMVLHLGLAMNKQACADKSPMSADGALAGSSLFKIIVESHLKVAVDSAFEDNDDAEYFRHPPLRGSFIYTNEVLLGAQCDEQLALYALIARVAADTTIPLSNCFVSDLHG